MNYLALTLCLCLFNFSSFAFSPKSVVLLEKTQSNALIKLNIGEKSGVQKKDYGTLLGVVSGGGQKKLVPFARLKLVALNKSLSIWRVISLSKNYLKEKNKYLFIGLKNIEDGRSAIQLKTRGYIQKDVPRSKEEFLQNQSRSFAERLDYIEQEKLHKVREWLDPKYIVELTRFSQPSVDNKKILTLLQSIPLLELQDQYKLETYEKMILAYLEKINNPLFQSDAHYIEHMRSVDGLYDRNKREEYQEFLKKRMGSLSGEDTALLKFWSKDNQWSSGMSDEDLEHAIDVEGELFEKKRQQDIYLNRYKWQVYTGINLNLINNQNTKDINNTEKSKIAFDLGLEHFVFRNKLKWRRFSIFGEFRNAQDGLSIKLANLLLTESSLAFGLNYYPFISSGSVEKPIFYIGSHLRVGQAELKINLPQVESNDYSVFGFGIRGGMIYRWSARWGISSHLMFEKNNLSSSNVKLSSTFESSTSYSYLGVGFRINYVF